MSRTLPTKTRVYGPPSGIRRGLARAAALAGVCLVAALWAAPSGLAQSEPDCARPAQGRELIARLRLAEIEGAEDIHREAMWEAFGRCPEGAAGTSCRTAERERFETEWEGLRARIEAKYRGVLSDFERRCRAILSRAGLGPPTGAS